MELVVQWIIDTLDPAKTDCPKEWNESSICLFTRDETLKIRQISAIRV